jgi:hypothetical protein
VDKEPDLMTKTEEKKAQQKKFIVFSKNLQFTCHPALHKN